MKTKINILLGAVALFAVVTAANAQTAIDGSPYVDEKYVDGEFFLARNNQKASVRYNAFQDVMEYKQNGQAFVIDPSQKVKKVRVGTETYIVDKFEFKGKNITGFLAVLDSGKVQLFSKKTITFADVKKGGALDGTDLPARYTRLPDAYYYKIGDGPLIQIENLKNMIASFPDKQEELSKYSKQEKVTPKKAEKLIKLVQYYNSL